MNIYIYIYIYQCLRHMPPTPGRGLWGELGGWSPLHFLREKWADVRLRAVPKREGGRHEAPRNPETPGDSGGGKMIGRSVAETPES